MINKLKKTVFLNNVYDKPSKNKISRSKQTSRLKIR